MGFDEKEPRARWNELATLREFLLRRAAALTRSPHDAEDLVQTAFERLCQMPDPVPAALALKLLSQTIVKRLVIDRSRHARRWGLSELADDHSDDQSAQPEPESDAAWQAITPLQLEAALQRCAAEDRETFLLHYIDGLRYSEIAARLGIAIGTVATRLHRTRAQLRTELERLVAQQRGQSGRP